MARYTEAVCRLCRREGAKLYLKGSRCYSKKCAFERRPSPPGQHGVRRRKVGEYGLQVPRALLGERPAGGDSQAQGDAPLRDKPQPPVAG